MFSKRVIELPYPDNSGSDAFRRFDYQLACVFQTLLSLCETNENFFVLLDYLDDFVIVENAGKEDESITFCQVKTQKSGPFSLYMVAKKEWVKKQVKNYLDFTDSIVKNVLLTNFGVKIGNKIVDDASLISLADYENNKDASQLIDQIKNALNGKGSLGDFYLFRATLSLDEFETQIRGELADYATRHNYSKMSVETIQTIYLKLWKELNTKQNFVLAEKDSTDFQKILDKKGIKYSQVKDVFRTAMEIQVPEKKDMSSFYASYPFSIGSDTLPCFLIAYEDFRIKSAMYGTAILKECSLCVKNNKDIIKSCKNSFDVSIKIDSLFFADVAINFSDFYHEFRYQIVALFVYKFFTDD